METKNFFQLLELIDKKSFKFLIVEFEAEIHGKEFVWEI